MSSAHRALLLGALCVLVLPWPSAPALGQASPQVRPGSTVRITAPSENLKADVGVVQVATPDLLMVDFGEPRGLVQLAVEDISAAEISLGKKSRRILGMFLGAGLVGTIGWHDGKSAGDDPGCGEPQAPVPVICPSLSADNKAVLNAMAGIVLGGFAGYHLGKLFKTDVWGPTTMGSPSLRLNLFVQPSPTMRTWRPGLAGRVAF